MEGFSRPKRLQHVVRPSLRFVQAAARFKVHLTDFCCCFSFCFLPIPTEHNDRHSRSLALKTKAVPGYCNWHRFACFDPVQFDTNGTMAGYRRIGDEVHGVVDQDEQLTIHVRGW